MTTLCPQRRVVVAAVHVEAFKGYLHEFGHPLFGQKLFGRKPGGSFERDEVAKVPDPLKIWLPVRRAGPAMDTGISNKAVVATVRAPIEVRKWTLT